MLAALSLDILRKIVLRMLITLLAALSTRRLGSQLGYIQLDCLSTRSPCNLRTASRSVAKKKKENLAHQSPRAWRYENSPRRVGFWSVGGMRIRMRMENYMLSGPVVDEPSE
jgi:hypothetical protein